MAEHDNVDLIVGLLDRLPHEPRSMWRAKQLGGKQFFGWSGDSTRLADLIDLTEFTARATAVNRAKMKRVAARPTTDKPAKKIETEKVTTVAQLDWGTAMNKFNT